MRRLLALPRAACSFVALLALIGGVPWALFRFVGNPMPTRLTGITEAVDSMERNGIADITVVKILAVVVWILWVRLTIAIVMELVAVLHGMPARNIHVLGSNQRVAAMLLAPIVALFSTIGSPAGSVGAAPRLREAVAIPSSILLRAPLAGTAPRARSDGRVDVHAVSRQQVPATGPTWTVQRNDSFWGIAEHALGDGLRWREVVAANLGHEVAPGIVFNETTETIHPGWMLRLPSSAKTGGQASPAVVPRAFTAPSSAATLVEPGDTLSSIAEERYGDSDEWRIIWDANDGTTFGGECFSDPDLIRPGWKLLIPDDPSTAPFRVVIDPPTERPATAPTAATAATAATAGTAGIVATAATTAEIAVRRDEAMLGGREVFSESARRATAVSPMGPTLAAMVEPAAYAAMTDDMPEPVPEPAVDHEARLGEPPTGEAQQRTGLGRLLGPSAAMLLATGTIGLLDARRRHRLRRSPCGTRLPLPPRHEVALETQLRSVSNAERLARIDLCIRRAADALAPAGRQVLAVLVRGDGAVELVISGERASMPAAPPPLVQIRHDLRWSLPATVATEEIGVAARFAAFPCPGLIHIGRSEDAELFVDLEGVGVLAVDAEIDVADAVVRAAIAGLATSPFAENSTVITAGIEVPGGHRIVEVDDLDGGLDVAAQSLSAVLGALRPGDTTFALRHRSSGESWEPAVVAASHGSRRATLLTDDELIGFTNPPGRGLGVIAAGAVSGASWVLTDFADGWQLAPLGVRVEPIGVTPTHACALADLLARASDIEAPVEPAARVALIAPFVATPWTLMVRTFGAVDVVDANGQVASFEKSKALELVAWLADHAGTPTRSSARAALWEEPVRDATFANVVSEARRALGRLANAPAGEDWVGRTLTETLPLHGAVTTDADVLFERLACAQRVDDAESAVAILRPGLELVRGAPYDGSGYLWPDAEGRASNMLLLATAAAAELGERYLELHDLDGVFWATGRGLSVLPGHEELISIRMRAHAAAGDFAGVRAEWQQYERVLLGDVWSDGEPSPKLVGLRAALLRPTGLTQ